MKTSQELRLENLTTLCQRFKNRADFARHLGKAPTLVSRWFLHSPTDSSRSIGHAAAREVEELMGLPRGWLDNDHTSPAAAELPQDEAELLALYRRVPEPLRAALLAAARAIFKTTSK